jgi:ABC-2 type transport system permease protein
MKRYFKIYKMLLKMNFSLLLTYRANFINGLVSTLGWAVFQMIWVLLLTYRTQSVYGWSRNELIILAASYVFVIAIFHFFFSRNFERLSRIIDRGQLDSLLLKPVDSQFLVSCWIIRFTNFFRVLFGAGLLYFLLNKMQIQVSWLNVIGFCVLTFFGLTLLYSLWFIVSTLLIWFPQLNNLIDFLYTINGMARYPSEMIYKMPLYFIIIALPFAITVVTPTKILFNKALNGDVLGLVILSAALFYLSRKFWQFALRYYTSVGS